MVTFTPPHTFVPSPSYPPVAGVLEIESDDGFRADYTVWLRSIIRAYRRQSRWSVPPFCPAVNTARIDSGPRYMTRQQLQRMQAIGCEIISHGRWHIHLGNHPVTSSVTSGTTSIPTSSGPGVSIPDGITYEIVDGDESEEFAPADYSSGAFHLDSPLGNGYPSSAVVRMSSASQETVMQGCVDDLAAWGIDCNHHSWTWGQSSPTSRSRAEQVFVSARSTQPGITPKGWTDLMRIRGGSIQGLDEPSIDSLLTDVIAQDAAAVVYGHAYTDPDILARLDHLVSEAVRRGVRIVTRAQLVEHITST